MPKTVPYKSISSVTKRLKGSEKSIVVPKYPKNIFIITANATKGNILKTINFIAFKPFSLIKNIHEQATEINAKTGCVKTIENIITHAKKIKLINGWILDIKKPSSWTENGRHKHI